MRQARDEKGKDTGPVAFRHHLPSLSRLGPSSMGNSPTQYELMPASRVRIGSVNAFPHCAESRGFINANPFGT